MFTLEIAGRPVAVIGARDEAEAQDIVESDAFQEDLRRLLNDDATPLWDGEADLSLRRANEAEIAEFEADNEGEDEEEDEDDEDALEVMFLVPISEPDEPEE